MVHYKVICEASLNYEQASQESYSILLHCIVPTHPSIPTISMLLVYFSMAKLYIK